MTCPKCSKPLSECKYPVSHSHPTVENVKLPAGVSSVGARHTSGTYKNLSSADRSVMNDFQP